MDLVSFATYVSGVAIYTLLGVVLLCSDIARTAEDSDFARVRRILALSSFLEGVKNVAVVMAMMRGMNWLVLNHFLIPVSFFIEVFLVSMAMFGLMHSKKFSGGVRLLMFLPVVVLSVAYLSGYALHSGLASIHLSAYLAYVDSPFAKILTVILLASITLDLAVFGVLLVGESRRFTRNVGNYFSCDVQKGHWITRMLYFYIAYMTVSCVDFLVSGNLTMDIVLTWADLILYSIFNVAVLNLQGIFTKSAPAFRKENTGENPESGAEPEKVTSAEKSYMDEIVREWSRRSDKPYTKYGLTLSDAAAQMGVNPRLLSAFVNDILDMNFNTWINKLRIDEVKRLMSEQPKLTMMDLADITGFTDAPAMSRTFKRFMNVTPTQYKADLNN